MPVTQFTPQRDTNTKSAPVPLSMASHPPSQALREEEVPGESLFSGEIAAMKRRKWITLKFPSLVVLLQRIGILASDGICRNFTPLLGNFKLPRSSRSQRSSQKTMWSCGRNSKVHGRDYRVVFIPPTLGSLDGTSNVQTSNVLSPLLHLYNCWSCPSPFRFLRMGSNNRCKSDMK